MFFETAPIGSEEELDAAEEAMYVAVDELLKTKQFDAGYAEYQGGEGPDGMDGLLVLGYELPWTTGCADSMSGPGEPMGFAADYVDDAVAGAKKDLVSVNARLAMEGWGIEFDVDGLADLARASEAEVNSDPDHAVRRRRKSADYVQMTADCELKVPVKFVKNLRAVQESADAERDDVLALAALAKRAGA